MSDHLSAPPSKDVRAAAWNPFERSAAPAYPHTETLPAPSGNTPPKASTRIPRWQS